eukprot:12629608-Heterocapsa_arctica.AAC.1
MNISFTTFSTMNSSIFSMLGAVRRTEACASAALRSATRSSASPPVLGHRRSWHLPRHSPRPCALRSGHGRVDQQRTMATASGNPSSNDPPDTPPT